MVIKVSERRRQLGMLRVVGATRKQFRRVILSEATRLYEGTVSKFGGERTATPPGRSYRVLE